MVHKLCPACGLFLKTHKLGTIFTFLKGCKKIYRICDRDSMWPTRPKIFNIWPVIEKTFATLQPQSAQAITNSIAWMASTAFISHNSGGRGYKIRGPARPGAWQGPSGRDPVSPSFTGHQSSRPHLTLLFSPKPHLNSHYWRLRVLTCEFGGGHVQFAAHSNLSFQPVKEQIKAQSKQEEGNIKDKT